MGGRRQIADRVVVGVLTHGQQRDMGETQVADIFNQFCRQFPVAQPAWLLTRLASPGAQVNFVEGQGGVATVPLPPAPHPAPVTPAKGLQILYHRGEARRTLCGEGIGI